MGVTGVGVEVGSPVGSTTLVAVARGVGVAVGVGPRVRLGSGVGVGVTGVGVDVGSPGASSLLVDVGEGVTGSVSSTAGKCPSDQSSYTNSEKAASAGTFEPAGSD